VAVRSVDWPTRGERVNVPREEAAVTFRVTDLMIEAVPEGAAKKKK
jgi:hypothetical protein